MSLSSLVVNSTVGSLPVQLRLCGGGGTVASVSVGGAAVFGRLVATRAVVPTRMNATAINITQRHCPAAVRSLDQLPNTSWIATASGLGDASLGATNVSYVKFNYSLGVSLTLRAAPFAAAAGAAQGDSNNISAVVVNLLCPSVPGVDLSRACSPVLTSVASSQRNSSNVLTVFATLDDPAICGAAPDRCASFASDSSACNAEPGCFSLLSLQCTRQLRSPANNSSAAGGDSKDVALDTRSRTVPLLRCVPSSTFFPQLGANFYPAGASPCAGSPFENLPLSATPSGAVVACALVARDAVSRFSMPSFVAALRQVVGSFADFTSPETTAAPTAAPPPSGPHTSTNAYQPGALAPRDCGVPYRVAFALLGALVLIHHLFLETPSWRIVLHERAESALDALVLTLTVFYGASFCVGASSLEGIVKMNDDGTNGGHASLSSMSRDFSLWPSWYLAGNAYTDQLLGNFKLLYPTSSSAETEVTMTAMSPLHANCSVGSTSAAEKDLNFLLFSVFLALVVIELALALLDRACLHNFPRWLLLRTGASSFVQLLPRLAEADKDGRIAAKLSSISRAHIAQHEDNEQHGISAPHATGNEVASSVETIVAVAVAAIHLLLSVAFLYLCGSDTIGVLVCLLRCSCVLRSTRNALLERRYGKRDSSVYFSSDCCSRRSYLAFAITVPHALLFLSVLSYATLPRRLLFPTPAEAPAHVAVTTAAFLLFCVACVFVKTTRVVLSQSGTHAEVQRFIPLFPVTVNTVPARLRRLRDAAATTPIGGGGGANDPATPSAAASINMRPCAHNPAVCTCVTLDSLVEAEAIAAAGLDGSTLLHIEHAMLPADVKTPYDLVLLFLGDKQQQQQQQAEAEATDLPRERFVVRTGVRGELLRLLQTLATSWLHFIREEDPRALQRRFLEQAIADGAGGDLAATVAELAPLLLTAKESRADALERSAVHTQRAVEHVPRQLLAQRSQQELFRFGFAEALVRATQDGSLLCRLVAWLLSGTCYVAAAVTVGGIGGQLALSGASVIVFGILLAHIAHYRSDRISRTKALPVVRIFAVGAGLAMLGVFTANIIDQVNSENNRRLDLGRAMREPVPAIDIQPSVLVSCATVLVVSTLLDGAGLASEPQLGRGKLDKAFAKISEKAEMLVKKRLQPQQQQQQQRVADGGDGVSGEYGTTAPATGVVVATGQTEDVGGLPDEDAQSTFSAFNLASSARIG